MEVLRNELLSKHTTIKVGGNAILYHIPDDKDELLKLLKSIGNDKFYVISGGSNLLINDEKSFENVIYMGKVDESICHISDGVFYCGASVRIQQLIKSAKMAGYGGIEYLYSLPAMLGGIVCMNAGRGKDVGCSISDVVLEVYAINNGTELTLSKEQCNFSYRKSIFRDSSYIITGVKLRLIPQDGEKTEKRIQERLELCKSNQDHSGGTFGTVFSSASATILYICQKLSKKSGIHWSQKRGNWFINDGTGTFQQAYKLMKRCELLHKLSGKKVKAEVCIWK